MSAARKSFYDTLNVITGLGAAPLLTDVFPPTDPHNNRARILRSGLVVSAFSHLEAYIENRLDEVLPELASSPFGYATFGDNLRRFFSVDAIQGLSQRIRFMEKMDALPFVEANLPRVASFTATPPIFTGLGFSPFGSNVSAEDVSNLLKAFGITDGWRKLRSVCSSVGATPLSLKEDFKNLIRTRNKAAHDSTTNVPSLDLSAHLRTVRLIAIAMDIALTHAIRSHSTSTTYEAAAANAAKLAYKLRFIDVDVTGQCRERTKASGRAIKLHTDLSSALQAATRPITGYVVRDSSLLPTRLH